MTQKPMAEPIVRLLLVEDEKSVRLTLAANFELDAFEVSEAEDAERALALLSNGHSFDLVLTDVRMPGMNGVALAKEIRRRRPALPIVLMTAFTEDDELRVGLEAGVYTVLAKPFDLAGAVRTLRRAAARPSVLVVDDDRPYGETLAAALRAAGHDAIAVFDGAAAIEAARAHDVDVCISDLKMPGMDGVELLSRLRQHADDVRLIAFSGYEVPAMMARAAAGGVFMCLRKPLDIPQLLVVMAHARSKRS